jgi:transketolase
MRKQPLVRGEKMRDQNDKLWKTQQQRNQELLTTARYLHEEITSEVLPLKIDIANTPSLDASTITALESIQIDAARIAITTLASLANINELDHLGGGLGIVPPLSLSLALVDFEKKAYTIENAHSSIGYYAVLAAYGYLDKIEVIEKFRRSLGIAGHVSWLPGGTQLNGGRLGVMIPVSVGQALGKRGIYGEGSWVITHCGDAGWISGQALNGFNGADLHKAPITFVMDRNGIQLSGSNKQIMDKDPRPIIQSLGIKILEITTNHDTAELYQALHEGYQLALKGQPALIYPTGYQSDLQAFGQKYNIQNDVESFANKQKVNLDKKIWIPGSLMSFRDIEPMLECIFLVNDLPGGAGHHDGHMKGRDLQQVLANPMLQKTEAQRKIWETLLKSEKRVVITNARPRPGSPNLPLSAQDCSDISLPDVGKSVSPRAGVDAGYAAVAKKYPNKLFIVSCDLDTSTKLKKARSFIPPDHQFEMSIEEQASSLIANGLAMSTHQPQLNVFSTFGAFFDGIAREGFELWRYQRNLNGINEGLNVTMHMSHVGACTGRDHFSGWSLDWISLALGYLPYLHRFYAPADARSAFVAVRDLAAHYGGHIIGIPRDNLPILHKQDNDQPLWSATDSWTPVTIYRQYKKAKRAILAIGAPAFLAGEAAETLAKQDLTTDVIIINGFPLAENTLADIFAQYTEGIVTVEDSIIATKHSGLRGFASVISSAAYGKHLPLIHIGITDPRIAPSDGHLEVWEHFGITKEAMMDAIKNL